MADALIDPGSVTDADKAVDDANADKNVDTSDTSGGADADKKPADGGSDGDPLIFGKYKDMTEAEKGHKELVQKLTEKRPGAPENYDFNYTENETFKEFKTIPDFDLNLAEDPMVKALAPVFKEHNLPQDAVNDLVKAYLDTEMASTQDPGDIKQALGTDADIIIKEANLFVAKNLNTEEQGIATQLGSSLEGIKFLHKMAQLSRSRNIPTEGEYDFESADDLLKQADEIFKKHNGNPQGPALREYEELTTKAARKQLEAKG